jgi:DNA-binding transcriptional LysR family regulator
MDTRFLASFVAVVEEGSIAAAARRLNLTPAALAQRIRTLEQDIGAPLLVRAGRKVAAAEAGLCVLDRARALLRDVRDMQASATGGGMTGELRLGAISTALTGLLPDILARMAERYPELDIHLSPGMSTDLYRRVLEGGLDAALMVQPEFALPKSHGWQPLREEPMIVLAQARHAGAEAHALLQAEPFIRYDRNQWGGRLADRYLRDARLRLKERFELDALDAIAVMVDRGLGVSLVPDWAPPWPAGIAVTRLPLPRPCPPRRLGLVWARHTARARLVEALVSEAAARPEVARR